MVDLKGFVALVDFIDGVDFDVPVNMNYDDPTQDLSIHFEKGMQHLEGQEALEVVRFRHNNDGTGYLRQDLDRIQTTQKLIKTVAKKMITPKTLFKLNDLVEIAEENVDTDLKFGELLWIAQEALGVDTEEGIHFYTLSEKSSMYQGLSYVFVDENEALELINSTINPYTTDITDLDVIDPR
jgi:anionic cell wall polymer biosynthesis LytR-Cps2A-Psr (LCP) family protein